MMFGMMDHIGQLVMKAPVYCFNKLDIPIFCYNYRAIVIGV